MRITRVVEKIYVHDPITKIGKGGWDEVPDWEATIDYIQENYCSQGQEARGTTDGDFNYIYIVEVVNI